MAEMAVLSVINQLYPLLNQEANFLRGVQGKIEFITDELESIQSFLRDADAREERDESVKTWVKQVRKLAYDIEDVIDKFTIISTIPPQHGIAGFIHRSVFLIKTLIPRHAIANELQNLKTRVLEIKGRSEHYRFDSSCQIVNSSNTHDLRMASLYVEEAELMGIEKPRDDMISLLLQKDSRRTVISVVGMGGCGKTTLTKKVYDNFKVMSCFECRAWVTISQSPKIDELLRMMIKQFHESMNKPISLQVETMEKNQLIDLLRQSLKAKRYVVVFDDVWSIDFWVCMKNALPDDKKGSRVIITTRNNTVALSCLDPCNHVYTLQPLAEKEAWELFCRKTFQCEFCPPELEELSQKILNKCGGLPLAIVAMGGLLSTKDKIVAEWTKLNDSLGYELESNPLLTGIPKVLSMSFQDLPYYLKPCFLYFALFPEDYSTGSRRLIQLWVAEGFASEENGKTPEEVAEDYLNELVHRSMIQVTSMYSDGRVKRCRVHDLMHDIILSKAREWNFSEVIAHQNSNPSRSVRRLSLHNNKVGESKSMNFSHLRSFLLFGRVHKDLQNSFTNASLWNLKLLKVLDLEDSCLDKLPNELGNLSNLRYLNVRNTNIKKLPNSIRKLQNLEILNVKDTHVHELPIGILKLQKLQHLLGYTLKSFYGTSLSPVQGMKVPDQRIGSLKNLRKLAFIEANHGSRTIEGLRSLRQLRRLGITKLRSEDSGDLCTSIEEMEYLKTLSLKAMDDKQFIDLQSMLLPPCFLQRLYLDGPLKKLPDWITSHKNLLRIRLAWSRLRDDPLQVLQTLPSLVDLVLHEAYDGEQLHLKAGQFKKLKILRLLRLGGLKHVIVGDGAASSLERLTVVYCRQLEEIPLGIENLKKLRTLEILGASAELDLRLLGKDGWRVKHIPNIHHR